MVLSKTKAFTDLNSDLTRLIKSVITDRNVPQLYSCNTMSFSYAKSSLHYSRDLLIIAIVIVSGQNVIIECKSAKSGSFTLFVATLSFLGHETKLHLNEEATQDKDRSK